MSELDEVTFPAQRFVDDMTAAGASAQVDGPRVLYDVRAVAGPLAGQIITTGVSLSEVQSWPMVPPHWVHLPDFVTFAQTNEDVTDCLPGWKRHSRDYNHTDTSVAPALSWLRHVRGLLTIALPKAA
ncbi:MULTISPECIES: hypothetical protein [unclassified Rathayibacter]|uniref:hypothetical protein n=1 Tax=unclassified Rathayibacter TaxID=2609250 RepID=UPI000CE79FE2|nr:MULTISPECIES: hypothetical protein [unclassified Rathayibacter]PPF47576.1 hypothetical protein C5E14_10030 [Rathayibacter sp. AY1A1]PPH03086.1 hypothetical protein C5C32_00695 [Rathayibacter sp. AY1G9]